jgi:hypothetical protein
MVCWGMVCATMLACAQQVTGPGRPAAGGLLGQPGGDGAEKGRTVNYAVMRETGY